MRKRRIVILGLAVGSWLAIACSSGAGGLAALGDGYERPPDLRENPGNGREAPPLTGDNPGSQGAGPGGGAGGSTCPPCDQRFSCVDGKEKDTITLSTVNGKCSAGKGVTLDCTGKVLLNGTAIGTWKGSAGSFTVTVTVDGQTQTQTCTPSTTTTTPTSTGTATAPTGTTTTVPPTDAGAKTCADLQACCAKITNASVKTSCTSNYESLKTNPASCSAVYPSYASFCP